MRDKTPIYWEQTLIGYVQDMKVDMFNWYGQWFPENAPITQKFLDTLNDVDELQVEIGHSDLKIVGYVSLESFYEDMIDITVR